MITICKVKIDNLTRDEVRLKLRSLLNSDHGNLVVTPNPEIVVAAGKNKEFRDVLNNADLSVPDGVGLMYASRFAENGPFNGRITGNDIMAELASLAENENKKILIIGGGVGLAQIAAKKLFDKYPNLQVEGISGGKIEYQNGNWHMEENLLDQINTFAPDIIVVSLGQIKQEMWITDHLDDMPSVRIAAGLGGVVDFLAGSIKRAPKSMQRLGLEWLWRLIQEPKRLPRIFTAVIIFPIIFIKSKLV